MLVVVGAPLDHELPVRRRAADGREDALAGAAGQQVVPVGDDRRAEDRGRQALVQVVRRRRSRTGGCRSRRRCRSCRSARRARTGNGNVIGIVQSSQLEPAVRRAGDDRLAGLGRDHVVAGHRRQVEVDVEVALRRRQRHPELERLAAAERRRGAALEAGRVRPVAARPGCSGSAELACVIVIPGVVEESTPVIPVAPALPAFRTRSSRPKVSPGSITPSPSRRRPSSGRGRGSAQAAAAGRPRACRRRRPAGRRRRSATRPSTQVSVVGGVVASSCGRSRPCSRAARSGPAAAAAG